MFRYSLGLAGEDLFVQFLVVMNQKRKESIFGTKMANARKGLKIAKQFAKLNEQLGEARVNEADLKLRSYCLKHIENHN